jgi:hypothetical protein
MSGESLAAAKMLGLFDSMRERRTNASNVKAGERTIQSDISETNHIKQHSHGRKSLR